jgi:hypothetical protein
MFGNNKKLLEMHVTAVIVLSMSEVRDPAIPNHKMTWVQNWCLEYHPEWQHFMCTGR